MNRPVPAGIDYYAVDISTLSSPRQTGKLWKTDQDHLIAWLDGNSRLCSPESEPLNLNDWEELVSDLSSRSNSHPQFNYFLARLNRQGILDYHSSNFPPQLHLKAGGIIQELGSSAVPFPASAKLDALQLASKEMILLYTPYLVTLKNSKGDEFGLMHLKSLLLQNQERTAEEIGLTIAQAAWMHLGQISIPSITLMILKTL